MTENVSRKIVLSVRPIALMVLLMLFAFSIRADEPSVDASADEDAVTGTAVAAAADVDTKDDYYEMHELFVETLDQIEQNYMEKVSRRELIEAAIRGMMSELDQYSNYVQPDEMDSLHRMIDNEFAGIGIRIGLSRGQVTVIAPMPDSPAFEAGVRAGDAIIEIDGHPTKGLSLDDTMNLLKGEVGTEVTLAVRRGSGRETFTVKRDTITMETVVGLFRKPDGSWEYFIDPNEKIAYVRILSFGKQTADALRHALNQIKSDEARAVVLDLRFNPGGLVASAIEICDMLVADGRIVSVKGRMVPERVWDAKSRGTFDPLPMVVLVNHYSASASEITSGCLQDNDRVVVVGSRTWGKGVIQNVVELEHGGSALKLTTAEYFRPSGINIHRHPDDTDDDTWGVVPNDGFEIATTLDDDRRIAETFARADEIPKSEKSTLKQDEMLKNDAAMKKGVEYLREKIGDPKDKDKDKDEDADDSGKENKSAPDETEE